MGDNDFPIAMAGQGGSPYESLDPEMLRRLSQPSTIPPGGFKEFLKQYLPKVPGTQKPQGYFREELEGQRSYSQAGTDIPDFGFQQQYAQTEGGPVFEQLIAGAPSFDIDKGKGPLGRRAGEQLLRLQQGSGSMQNEQLKQELERRGIMPRGIQLPPV